MAAANTTCAACEVGYSPSRYPGGCPVCTRPPRCGPCARRVAGLLQWAGTLPPGRIAHGGGVVQVIAEDEAKRLSAIPVAATGEDDDYKKARFVSKLQWAELPPNVPDWDGIPSLQHEEGTFQIKGFGNGYDIRNTSTWIFNRLPGGATGKLFGISAPKRRFPQGEEQFIAGYHPKTSNETVVFTALPVEPRPARLIQLRTAVAMLDGAVPPPEYDGVSWVYAKCGFGIPDRPMLMNDPRTPALDGAGRIASAISLNPAIVSVCGWSVHAQGARADPADIVCVYLSPLPGVPPLTLAAEAPPGLPWKALCLPEYDGWLQVYAPETPAERLAHAARVRRSEDAALAAEEAARATYKAV